ncbi:nucleotide-binding protein [bacterium]|nr:nucleotide-binding protein [bacterium]
MELHAHIDGGARGNPGPAAIGIVIHDDKGNLLYEEGTYIGHGTNNEAEYRALIRLLEVCATDPVITSSGASVLRVACDSLLIVNQVLGEWKIKEPRLATLHSEVREAKKKVGFQLRIRYIPREENKDADRLVNKALDGESTERILTKESARATIDTVFVVYGRDSTARDQLELILRRIDINPIIIGRIHPDGSTIIDRLEQHLNACTFVCVLLTPDDEGRLRDSHGSPLALRARQNVVLELGWALGRLGRDKVAIIHKSDVDMPFEDPTDLRGLVHYQYKHTVEEIKVDLAKHLQKNGFTIDIQKL